MSRLSTSTLFLISTVLATVAVAATPPPAADLLLVPAEIKLDGALIIHEYGSARLVASTSATRVPAAAASRLSRVLDVDQVAVRHVEVDAPTPAHIETSRLRSGIHVLALVGPMDPTWLADLDRAGVTILESAPPYGLVVRASVEALERAGRLTTSHGFRVVRSIQPLPIAARIDPELAQIGSGKAPSHLKSSLDGRLLVRALPWSDREETDLVASISRIAELASPAEAWGDRATFRADGPLLAKVLAEIDEISWLEAVPERRLLNNIAAKDIVLNIEPVWGLGWNGSGVVVNENDSGVDPDHPDLSPGVVTATFGKMTGTDNAHGTHVAGSVLGRGTLGPAPNNTSGCGDQTTALSSVRGMAPAATMNANNLFDSGHQTITDMMKWAQQNGSDLSTNSWGYTNTYTYNSSSASVDRTTRDSNTSVAGNQEMLILFAAGNDGSGASTVGAPGTAKNALTVGASQNLRCGSYVPGSQAGPDIDNVVSFSSRGPSQGRIKPDILAVGADVLSVESDDPQATNGWDQGWTGSNYALMPGTSMATPIAAGAAAVFHQYYSATFTGSPSPALVKAALINGAVDTGLGFPSNAQGWGRLNLRNSIEGPSGGQISFTDQSSQRRLTTGQSWSDSFQISSSSTPLKITAVWSDAAGASGCTSCLINDLDLIVTAPNGTTYRGNRFSGAWSTANPGSTTDTVNNVENVFVASPATGQWTIQVRSARTQQSPAGISGQDFTVVRSGSMSGCAAPIPPTNLSATPNGENRIDLSWSAVGGVTKYRVLRGTSSGGPYAQIASLDAPATFYADTGRPAGTTFYYVVRSFKDCESSDSNQSSAAATQTPAEVLFVDDDGGQSFETAFTQALSASGRSFHVWTVATQGSPSAATMGAYQAVVWSHGAAYESTLTAADEASLATYLGGGGSLLLSSQDYLYERGAASTFETTWLGVASFTSDTKTATAVGVGGDPISAGMSISLAYPTGFTDYSDDLVPAGGATSIFTNANGASGAVRFSPGAARTVFFAFPFEAVSESGAPNNRSSLMDRTLDWLIGGAVTTHSISGSISSGGSGVVGVNVAYAGPSSGSVNTAADGSFSISALANGSYTLTPTKTDWSFAPTSLGVTVDGADVSGNFTATFVGATGPTVLTNGVPQAASVAKGADQHFVIAVPSGSTELTVTTTSATGDVDLYTRFGASPTSGSHDCRPYTGSGNETCTHENPQAGNWYVMVHGYAAGNFDVTATYTSTGAPGEWCHTFDGNDIGGFATATTKGTNTWALGTARVATGSHSAFSGYADANDTLLTTPSQQLGAGATLRFDHWYDIEAAWDGGIIQIAVDGGAWADIAPSAGKAYDGPVSTWAQQATIAPKNAFHGNSGGWVTSDVDLSSWAGSSVQFRFWFSSDDSTGAEGWYIDQVCVTYGAGGDVTNPTASVSTGPTGTIATGSGTFSWTGNDDTTATGNLVYSRRLDPVDSSWSAWGSSTSKAWSSLDDGAHTFRVRARDEAGNVSAEATRAFTVAEPPDTTISTGPTGTITVDSASFTWTGADNTTATASLQYQSMMDGVDAGWSAWGSTTSRSYSSLPDAAHTFRVRARDAATTMDPTEATRSFTVAASSGAPWCHDFDGGTAGGFTTSTERGAANWTLSTAQFQTGSHSGFSSYADAADNFLLTPVKTLGAGASLTFDHLYDIEAAYDGGLVQIAVDGGAWTDLTPTAGQAYTGPLSTWSGQATAAPRPAFHGNSATFVSSTVDLSAYSGSSVQVRFWLSTDDSTTEVGWYIDRVCISSTTGFTSPGGEDEVTVPIQSLKAMQPASGRASGPRLTSASSAVAGVLQTRSASAAERPKMVRNPSPRATASTRGHGTQAFCGADRVADSGTMFSDDNGLYLNEMPIYEGLPSFGGEWDFSAGEVVYEITTTEVGDLRAGLLTRGSDDLDVLILADWCDSADWIVWGETVAVYEDAPPATYYVVVDGYSGTTADYSLVIGHATGTLLVDGDRSGLGLPDVRGRWEDALRASSVSYDVWDLDTLGTPDPATLYSSRVVIWTSGGAWEAGTSVDAEARDLLAGYLFNSGRLWLGGQDLLFDVAAEIDGRLPDGSLLADDLQITSVVHDIGTPGNSLFGAAGDPIADGLDFTLASKAEGAPYNPYSDALDSRLGIPVFHSADGRPVAVRDDDGFRRSLFTAFSPANDLQSAKMDALVANAWAWLDRSDSCLTGFSDLTISGGFLSPTQPTAGGSHTFRVTVTNDDAVPHVMTASLGAGDPFMTVTGSRTIALGSVAAGGSANADFTFNLDPTTPAGWEIDLPINVSRGGSWCDSTLFGAFTDFADILLVKDESQLPNTTGVDLYHSVLTNLGYDVAVWDTARFGTPTFDSSGLANDRMTNYPFVLWMTGSDWAGTLDGADEVELAQYLDNGGNLLLVSQDYLFDRFGGASGVFPVGSFARDHLRLDSVSQDLVSRADADVDGLAGEWITEYTNLSIEEGRFFGNYADRVEPAAVAGARRLFAHADATGAAVLHRGTSAGGTTAYRSAFLPWALENARELGRPNDLGRFLAKLLGWMGTDAAGDPTQAWHERPSPVCDSVRPTPGVDELFWANIARNESDETITVDYRVTISPDPTDPEAGSNAIRPTADIDVTPYPTGAGEVLYILIQSRDLLGALDDANSCAGNPLPGF